MQITHSFGTSFLGLWFIFASSTVFHSLSQCGIKDYPQHHFYFHFKGILNILKSAESSYHEEGNFQTFLC